MHADLLSLSLSFPFQSQAIETVVLRVTVYYVLQDKQYINPSNTYTWVYIFSCIINILFRLFNKSTKKLYPWRRHSFPINGRKMICGNKFWRSICTFIFIFFFYRKIYQRYLMTGSRREKSATHRLLWTLRKVLARKYNKSLLTVIRHTLDPQKELKSLSILPKISQRYL